jgi:IS30 family transposase
MGTHYSHLSRHERQLMFTWYHYDKLSQREVARRLKRSHSTISRELKRNIQTNYVPTWYPHPAQATYELRIRRRAQRPHLKNAATGEYVIEKLKLGWTPEIIAGRLKRETATSASLAYICHESIYQFIYKEAPELIQYLPRKHKRRRKKYPYRTRTNKLTDRISISERPETINARSEFGHWESDSIVSGQQKPGCNVVVERVTRLAHISQLASKNAQNTADAIHNQLSQHPNDFVKTITYDNGQENAKHMEVNQKLNCLSYFCQPYHSWEKGAVEQVNGLIRRFIPKKTDITKISPETISEIENLLNSRPRKCLDYKTPMEVYQDMIDTLAAPSPSSMVCLT